MQPAAPAENESGVSRYLGIYPSPNHASASTFQSSARVPSLCDFRMKEPTNSRQSCAGLVFRNGSVVLRRGTYKLLKINGFRDGPNSSTSAADMPRPKQFPRAKIYRPFRANPMGKLAVSAEPASVPTYHEDRPFGAKRRRASRTPSALTPVITMPLKKAF
jgi:hypothetical protein